MKKDFKKVLSSDLRGETTEIPALSLPRVPSDIKEIKLAVPPKEEGPSEKFPWGKEMGSIFN